MGASAPGFPHFFLATGGPLDIRIGRLEAQAIGEGDEVRRTGPEAKRNVVITMQDESHARDVQKWILINAFPMKYTGPTLAAKGGTDVAMEEWVLAYETLRFEQVES